MATPEVEVASLGAQREARDMADWRQNLIEDEEGIAEIVRSSHRIAVLGIKTEAQAGQPAFGVPQYLQAAGLEIVPVPVYYPDVKEILGRPVYRKVADVPSLPMTAT